MRELLLAEWRKINGNRMLVSFLVWIYPVGLGMFMVGLLAGALFSPESTGTLAMAATSSGQWTSDMLGIWATITSFPGNIFLRMLPLAFLATVFAGEYQGQTWKVILPWRRRAALLAAKFAVAIGLITLSFAVTSLIIGAGNAAVRSLLDLPYGPPLAGPAIAEFVSDYAREAVLAVASLLVLAGFAALASLGTRSVVGGLLAGFGLSVVEPMSMVLLAFLGNLTDNPALINMYQFTPSYAVENMRAQFTLGEAAKLPFSEFTATPEAAVSALILLVWIVLLLGGSMWLFERQDIL